MKKSIIIFLIITALIYGLYFGLTGRTITKQEEGTQTVYTPVTLEIPSISVKSSVESVGKDGSGLRQANPADSSHVAWYNRGYVPGESGSAVISGHLDNRDGSPAVFYNLNKVAIGDKIIVIDSSGHKETFTVTNKEEYASDFSQELLQKIYNTSGAVALNLITCVGTWDAGTQNYSHRLVIYSIKQ